MKSPSAASSIPDSRAWYTVRMSRKHGIVLAVLAAIILIGIAYAGLRERPAAEPPGAFPAPAVPSSTVATGTSGVTVPAPQNPLPASPRPTCVVGGCNGILCVDQRDEPVMTTCEYREEYACYRTARCEPQRDGQCGWTDTAELRACIAAARD